MTSKYGPWPSEESEVWRRMARAAISESRRVLDSVAPNDRDIGDPNHPLNSGLFGEETSTFIARQYR